MHFLEVWGGVFWTLTILPQYFQSRSLWWSAGAKMILGYFCAGLLPSAVKLTNTVSRQSSCCQNINGQYVGIYLTSMWPLWVNLPLCSLSAVVVRRTVTTSHSLLFQCIMVRWVEDDGFFIWTLELEYSCAWCNISTWDTSAHMYCLHLKECESSFLRLAQDFKGDLWCCISFFCTWFLGLPE